MNSRKLIGLVLLVCCFLVGCKREGIQSYDIPKEEGSTEANQRANEVTPGMIPSESTALRWEIPGSWTETPDAAGMRLASYETPDGADFSIVQLPASDDLSNVNRWLRQLGRDPIGPNELPALMEEAGAGSFHIHLFTLEAEPEVDRAMLAAIYRQGAEATFFKLDGTRGAIAASRDAFVGVLRSLQVGPSLATPRNPVASSQPPLEGSFPGPGTAPMQVLPGMQEQVNEIVGATWTAPSVWQEISGSPIRKATYRTEGGAELAITAFPGDVGGLFANVNRWRGQLGLLPADEAGVMEVLQPLEVDGYPAHLVRLKSNSEEASASGVLGLIASLPDSTWFFKMTGPVEILEAEETTFVTFARTIEFSD